MVNDGESENDELELELELEYQQNLLVQDYIDYLLKNDIAILDFGLNIERGKTVKLDFLISYFNLNEPEKLKKLRKRYSPLKDEPFYTFEQFMRLRNIDKFKENL